MIGQKKGSRNERLRQRQLTTPKRCSEREGGSVHMTPIF